MKNFEGIKNIIFDFGNVIIDIDFQLTINQFKKLGFVEIEQFLKDNKSLGFLSHYQEGKMTDEQFLDKIRHYSGLELTDKAIVEAWNAMLLNYSVDRLEALNRLKGVYRIFLLSNTNHIHYQNFAFRVPNASCIDNYFDAAYYSHTMGLSKPSPEIYEVVLKEQGLLASETLFLDDLVENVEAAKKVGMQAQLVTHPDEWMAWF